MCYDASKNAKILIEMTSIASFMVGLRIIDIKVDSYSPPQG